MTRTQVRLSSILFNVRPAYWIMKIWSIIIFITSYAAQSNYSLPDCCSNLSAEFRYKFSCARIWRLVERLKLIRILRENIPSSHDLNISQFIGYFTFIVFDLASTGASHMAVTWWELFQALSGPLATRCWAGVTTDPVSTVGGVWRDGTGRNGSPQKVDNIRRLQDT